jgi:MFS family permease
MNERRAQAEAEKLPARPASLLRRPAFALFWSARTLCALAVQAESAAIGWQVYTLARHGRSVEEAAFLLGMVGLAQFAPLVALTFVAGPAVDRGDRRMILLACVGVEILCALTLALLAAQPNASLTAIFAIAGLFGASRAFLSPASAAIGPMLAPREEMPRIITWSAMGDQAASVIGPWIGGALCALSPAAAYSGATTLYVLAGAALLAMRANTQPAFLPGSRRDQIRDGIAYIRDNKVVLGAISLDLFAVLLGGVGALLPIYARDVLRIGASGFGALRSGPAIGAAIMAFALSRCPLRRRAGRWLFASVAAFGAATLIFAVSKSLMVSLIALAALGAADMISVYIRQSLVQLATPDAMRGRVSAAAGLFIGASAELGEFETGIVARLLGPVGAAIFGGVGSLVVAAAWARMFPSLRKADRLDGGGSADVDAPLPATSLH